MCCSAANVCAPVCALLALTNTEKIVFNSIIWSFNTWPLFPTLFILEKLLSSDQKDREKQNNFEPQEKCSKAGFAQSEYKEDFAPFVTLLSLCCVMHANLLEVQNNSVLECTQNKWDISIRAEYKGTFSVCSHWEWRKVFCATVTDPPNSVGISADFVPVLVLIAHCEKS